MISPDGFSFGFLLFLSTRKCMCESLCTLPILLKHQQKHRKEKSITLCYSPSLFIGDERMSLYSPICMVWMNIVESSSDSCVHMYLLLMKLLVLDVWLRITIGWFPHFLRNANDIDKTIVGLVVLPISILR